MNEILTFQNKKLKVTDINGNIWLASPDISHALGYKNSDQVSKIYNAYKDEFSPGMSQTVESTVSGNLKVKVRIFSLRGCHLIAMFSRTPVAKEFRKWVLDILEKYSYSEKGEIIPVSAHTRRLPSGKKEIVLSEKARSEIGGIVKAVLQAQMINRENIREILRGVIREEIADYILKGGIKQSRFNNKPTADGLPVANWVCGIIHGANALNNLIEQLCIRQKNAVDLLESKN